MCFLKTYCNSTKLYGNAFISVTDYFGLMKTGMIKFDKFMLSISFHIIYTSLT